MSQPAFYMASADTIPLLAPRACYSLQRIQVEGRDDYLRTRVEPPMPGAGIRLSEILLAVRWQGETLFPVSTWPLGVYVCCVLNDDIRRSGRATAADVQIIYWAELYPSQSKAEESLAPYAEQPRA